MVQHRRNHESTQYSATAMDRLYGFLQGPKYLLIFKIFLIIVFAVFYIIYYTFKTLLKHFIYSSGNTAKYIEQLIQSILDYSTFVYYALAKFIQHWSIEFYKKILKPLIFVIINRIFPAIALGIDLIIKKSLWFIEQSYQCVIAPTLTFLYEYVILPTIKLLAYIYLKSYVSIVLFSIILRKICWWTWKNIIEILLMAFITQILLPSISAMKVICLFIYIRILIPIFDLFVYIMKILKNVSYQFMIFLVKYTLYASVGIWYTYLWMKHYVFKPAISILFSVSLKVCTQILGYITYIFIFITPFIRLNLYNYFIYPIQCLLYEISNLIYDLVLSPLKKMISVILPLMTVAFNSLFIVTANSMNSLASAMAIASHVVVSLLRTMNESLRLV